MTENRNQSIDILRGIGILAVIVGHSYIFEYDSLPLAIIYSFHMPLFLLVSGYLYHDVPFGTKQIIKRIRTILVPYFGIAFVSMLLASPLENKTIQAAVIDIFVGNALEGRLSYNVALWYLPMYFLASCLFWGTRTIARKTLRPLMWTAILSILLAGGGYILMCVLHKRFIWSAEIALFSQVFFFAGHLYRYFEPKMSKLMKRPVYLLSLLMLLAIWAFGVHVNGRVDLNARLVKNLPVYLASALAGTYLLYQLSCKLLIRIRPMAWLLSWCGENSLALMALHLPVASIIYGGLHSYLPWIGESWVWKADIRGILYILFYTLVLCALLKHVIVFGKQEKTEKEPIR